MGRGARLQPPGAGHCAAFYDGHTFERRDVACGDRGGAGERDVRQIGRAGDDLEDGDWVRAAGRIDEAAAVGTGAGRRGVIEIGRASCRASGCQYVYISVAAVSLTKQSSYIYTHT